MVRMCTLFRQLWMEPVKIVSSINEQYLLISLISIAAVSTLLIIYLKKQKIFIKFSKKYL